MSRSHLLAFSLAVLSLTGGLAGGFAGAWVYQQTRMFERLPEMVTVDLQGLIRNSIIRTAEGQGSKQSRTEAEKSAAITAFAASLEPLMAEIARRQHLILVPKPAVIAGVRDITADIQAGLERSGSPVEETQEGERP